MNEAQQRWNRARTPEYWRETDKRYRQGQTYQERKRILSERKTIARRMLEALTPVASHETVAKQMGLSKQAIQQAETRILFKIFQRMRDPNFTP